MVLPIALKWNGTGRSRRSGPTWSNNWIVAVDSYRPHWHRGMGAVMRGVEREGFELTWTVVMSGRRSIGKETGQRKVKPASCDQSTNGVVKNNRPGLGDDFFVEPLGSLSRHFGSPTFGGGCTTTLRRRVVGAVQ